MTKWFLMSGKNKKRRSIKDHTCFLDFTCGDDRVKQKMNKVEATGHQDEEVKALESEKLASIKNTDRLLCVEFRSSLGFSAFLHHRKPVALTNSEYKHTVKQKIKVI